MKKQTIYLLFLGTALMSFTVLARHFFETSSSIEDFIKGIGVSFVISSIVIQRRLERKEAK